MQGILRAFYFSILFAVIAVPAAADDHTQTGANGWYVQAGIGGSITKDQDFENPLVGKGEYKPDFGIGGIVEVGRQLSDTWRVGLGAGWARGFDGKLDFKDPSLTDSKIDGHGDVYTLHLNAYYYLGEMQGLFGPIQPFVGAGIGLTHFDIGDVGGASGKDTTDTVFSGALRVGYDTKLRPGITLTSTYSVGYTGEAEFTNNFGFPNTRREAQVDFITFTGLRFALD